MDHIVDIIKNEDLSLEELGEIVKEALAKIYSKLRTEIGFQYPTGIIRSMGEKSYDVDVRFIDGNQYGPGESYEQIYYL